MKKFTKRFLTMTIVLVMMLSTMVFTPMTVNAVTKIDIEEVIRWAEQQIDVPTRYQCIGLGQTISSKFWGINLLYCGNRGGPQDLINYDQPSDYAPYGWTQIKTTDKSQIKRGDFVIFLGGEYNDYYGHIGLAISSTQMIDANGGTDKFGNIPNPYTAGTAPAIHEIKNNFIGIIRPAYKETLPKTPTQSVDELIDVTKDFIEKNIALKPVENGKYISSWQNEKSAPLYARVDKADFWEIFKVVGTSDGWAGFIGVNGKYVSARGENKNVPLTTEATKLQKWECFKIYKKGDDYYIKTQANGQWVTVCLDIKNAPLRARADNVSTWERFKIEIIPDNPSLVNGPYTIKNVGNTSQVLNVYTDNAPKNHDEVTLCKPFNGDIAQIWTLEKYGDAYIIHSGNNGIVLNVFADTARNGDNVNVLKYFTGDGSQLWIIENVGNGKYVIHSQSNRDVVLTVFGSYNGLPNVKVQTYNGSENQLWYFDKI
jgi:hypothetical protein